MSAQGGGGRGAERGPLPMVVLGVEQEVGAHDGHTHCHNGQDEEHQQHEAVHVVHLHDRPRFIIKVCWFGVAILLGRFKRVLCSDCHMAYTSHTKRAVQLRICCNTLAAPVATTPQLPMTLPAPHLNTRNLSSRVGMQRPPAWLPSQIPSTKEQLSRRGTSTVQ